MGFIDAVATVDCKKWLVEPVVELSDERGFTRPFIAHQHNAVLHLHAQQDPTEQAWREHKVGIAFRRQRMSLHRNRERLHSGQRLIEPKQLVRKHKLNCLRTHTFEVRGLDLFNGYCCCVLNIVHGISSHPPDHGAN